MEFLLSSVKSRVTLRVCQKIAQMKPSPFFVKINTRLIPWEKSIPKICNFLHTAPKVNNRPIFKKIAQSGHPD
jgi:hypothetical protein